MTTFVGLVAAGLLTVLLLLWHNRRLAARRRLFQQWADSEGWTYQLRSPLWRSRWSSRKLTGPAEDILTRQDERGTVVSLALPMAAINGRHAAVVAGPTWYPALSLTPTSVQSRLEVGLGGQDIEVEAYDVNERWRAVSTDERFAHAVLNPRLLELLEGSLFPGLCLHVEDRDVVLHHPGPVRFELVGHLADLALDVAALMPSFLADDHPPLPPEVPRRQRRRRRRLLP